jgi:hypothetical protein
MKEKEGPFPMLECIHQSGITEVRRTEKFAWFLICGGMDASQKPQNTIKFIKMDITIDIIG